MNLKEIQDRMVRFAFRVSQCCRMNVSISDAPLVLSRRDCFGLDNEKHQTCLISGLEFSKRLCRLRAINESNGCFAVDVSEKQLIFHILRRMDR